MKFLISAIFFVVTLSVTLAEVHHPLSQEFINSINQKQPSWVAGRNYPENTTLEYLNKRNGFRGLHPDPNYKPTVKVQKVDVRDVPESFDARDKWSYCQSLFRIRDQGACGSCWAFASVEAIADRLCIQSNGASQFIFSPEDLLACCGLSCGDCTFGYMMPAFDYYLGNGLVSGGDVNSNEGCMPYSQQSYSGVTPTSCSRSCRSGYSLDYNGDKHYGHQDYVISNAIEEIQYEIMTNGPIIVNYEVFEDFYSYQSGVYHHVDGNSVGFHVVKIIGWGTENGQPYWLIANSWGSGFGQLGGYFKMLRGSNECGIENNPYAVLPRL